jgi:hypothetical protein
MNFYRRMRRPFAASEPELPLNWRRGLFRLWLLVSAAWLMGWSIYFILSAMAQAFKTLGDLLAIPVVFFGPPIALLLCGLATGWAVRGFKAEKASAQSAASTPAENVVPLPRSDVAQHREPGTGAGSAET